MSIFEDPRGVEHYEEWFKKHPLILKSEVSAILKLIPNGIGFEVGTGTGIFASELGINLGNDISLEMLKVAQNRGVKTVCANAESLPFKSNNFDFLLMVTTICFIENVKESLFECKRILKKRGKIIVAFVNEESQIGRGYLKRKNRSKFYKDAKFYSPADIISFLGNSGFAVDKSVSTLFGELTEINNVQEAKIDMYEGSFVVIRAVSI